MADTPATPTPPGNGPTDGQQGGGDGSATPPAPPAQQQQNQQGPTPAPSSEPGGTQPSEQQGQQGLENATPDELRAEIKRLRQENARDRTNAKQTAAQEAETNLVNRLAAALGFGDDDGDNTPSADDLQTQLEQSQQAQRQRDVEFAAWRAAAKADVDPEVLLNQVSFQKRIADLDPSADTFSNDLNQAIEAERKENSLFEQHEPIFPGRSSQPLNNRRGNDGKGNSSQGPAELAKAINKLTPY